MALVTAIQTALGHKALLNVIQTTLNYIELLQIPVFLNSSEHIHPTQTKCETSHGVISFSPVVQAIQAKLLAHVPNHDTWQGLQRLWVPDRCDKGVKTMTHTIMCVKLGVYNGMGRHLAEVSHPDLCGLKVWRVENKFLKEQV